MKKIALLFTIVMCMFAVTEANAQKKGEMAAGAQLVYGTGDGISNFGLGAKFQWNVIDNLRLEPSFNYFFEKDMVGMWDFSANAHYQFSLNDSFVLYPLAGICIMGVSVDVPEINLGYGYTIGGSSASDTEVGFNIGGGADYNITKNIAVNLEAKYKVGGEWSRFVVAAGVVYKF